MYIEDRVIGTHRLIKRLHKLLKSLLDHPVGFQRLKGVLKEVLDRPLVKIKLFDAVPKQSHYIGNHLLESI